jgi:hypothetical protein
MNLQAKTVLSRHAIPGVLVETLQQEYRNIFVHVLNNPNESKFTLALLKSPNRGARWLADVL